MNRMYHIKQYIQNHCLLDSTGKQIISIEKIIDLFLEYLDKEKTDRKLSFQIKMPNLNEMEKK